MSFGAVGQLAIGEGVFVAPIVLPEVWFVRGIAYEIWRERVGSNFFLNKINASQFGFSAIGQTSLGEATEPLSGSAWIQRPNQSEIWRERT